MPIHTERATEATAVWTGTIDARWTMAHAASLHRVEAQYLDSRVPDGVVAHPMFPVCPEWQVLTEPTTPAAPNPLGLTADESLRGVHASHDLTLHAQVRPQQTVAVRGAIAGIEATPAGGYVTHRFDATGDDGPLWTTWMGNVYRGVGVEGPDLVPADRPAAVTPVSDAAGTIATDTFDLSASEAHTYTECARIWNPIHTDVAVAHAAGLPGLILHGTANLSHGVSFALDVLGGDATSVRRIGGSFRAMVTLPSTIQRRVTLVEDFGDSRVAYFEVVNGEGDVAVRDGFVVVRA